MALSGQIINNFRTGYQLRIDWTATQSIVNNESTVTVKMYLKSTGSPYNIISSATKYGSITLDGSVSNFSGAGLSNLDYGQDKLLHTYVKTINHSSDGSKNFNLGGEFGLNVTLGGTYYGTITLPTTNFTLNVIPRATIITSFPNFTITRTTQNISVNIQSYSSSFTLNSSLYLGGTLIKSWNGLALNGTTQTLSLQLTGAEQDAMLDLLPNATTSTVWFYCQTKQSTNDIGTIQSKSAVATVSSTIIPTLTSVTALENTLVVKALNNNNGIGNNTFLESLSDLKLTINGATAGRGATVSTYRIVLNGQVYNTQVVNSTGKLSLRGSYNLTATVTDSRGRTSNVATTPVTFLQYTPPSINSLTVVRADSDGSDNPIGTYAKVKYNINVSSISPAGGELNSITYLLENRVKDVGNFTVLTPSTTEPNGIITKVVDYALFSGYVIINSYDFRLTVTDAVESTTIHFIDLATGEVTMSWGRNGIGVGKIYENGTLDVGGDIYENGTKLSDKYLTVASGVADKTYVHTQGSPSSAWVINHNLNKNPSVDVVNSFGDLVIGDVKYNSINSLTITFVGGFSGKAYLN